MAVRRVVRGYVKDRELGKGGVALCKDRPYLENAAEGAREHSRQPTSADPKEPRTARTKRCQTGQNMVKKGPPHSKEINDVFHRGCFASTMFRKACNRVRLGVAEEHWYRGKVGNTPGPMDDPPRESLYLQNMRLLP